ncbi:DinB family protein [Thiolinea disciformis]|uniref:DinB family protein n=1 Tax=Thiolinea disciformis TaxID=125614 RepID=UPI00036B9A28|nr:DinB family protein [Thiolinea disciformis]
MQCKTQLRLLAEYNTGMNQQLYQVAAQLSPETLGADKKAFFKSILGSYNHIMVGDLIWLRRFTKHPTSFDLLTALHSFPTPQRLDEILYADFVELWQKRTQLDQIIEQWTSSLDEDSLGITLAYHTMKGAPANRILVSLLMHFFTHQIHHRGQITTLLAQEGLDFGETDLLLIIPNIEP